MSIKRFIKSFEDFRGLDLRSSALTRKTNFATECLNMEIRRDGEGWALQGRKGTKVLTQPDIGTGVTSETVIYPYQGLFTYTFQDALGQTQEELLGIGNGLYKVQTGTVALTYGGGGTCTFETYVSSSQWYADLKINGTSQTGFPLALGTGESSADATLNTLRTAINAIAGCACVLTPWAQVNGNQTGAGVGQRGTPITVFAGHTVTASTSAQTRIELNDKTGGTTRICRDVIATTATTITLSPPIGFGDIDVLNNDIIGIGLYSAAQLGRVPQTTLSASASVFNISYWERIYFPRYAGSGDEQLMKISDANALNSYYGSAATPYFGVNKSNVFYIGAKKNVNDHSYSLRNYSGVYRYDGREVYGADLPPGIILGATAGAGAGMSVGTYRYITRNKFIDNRGNVHYGPDNRFSYDNRPTGVPNQYQDIAVTTTAGNTIVTLTVLNPLATGSNAYYRNYLTSVKLTPPANIGAAAGVPVVFATTAFNYLRVGDYVTFLNRVDNRIQTERVTSVGALTLGFTGSRLWGMAGNDQMTNGWTVEVWRTKVGGNVFYLLNEYIPDFAAGTNLVITDNVADTALLQQYEEPLDSPDPPPVLDCITTHQGLLTGIGDPTNPQTLYWSSVDNDVGFPISTNSIDINTISNDTLTAVASDTENMLAVFSRRTHTNVTGDLATLSIAVDTTIDGDVGCAAPHSLRKVRDKLIYLSLKGFRSIRGGQYLPIDDRLATLFVNQFYQQPPASNIPADNEKKFYLLRAYGIHDIENQRYICVVPKESGGPSLGYTYANGNSAIFVYDYHNDYWAQWDKTGNGVELIKSGQLAVYQQSIFFNNRWGSVPSESRLYNFNNLGDVTDYHDSCVAITRSLSPQWELYNEPSIDKKFLHGKVWSLGNGIGSFSLLVKAYRNFNTSTIDTQATLSFTTAIIEQTWKFKENKCRSMQLNFSDATVLTNPIITGYEYVIAINYGADDLAEIK